MDVVLFEPRLEINDESFFARSLLCIRRQLLVVAVRCGFVLLCVVKATLYRATCARVRLATQVLLVLGSQSLSKRYISSSESLPFG